MAQLKPSKSQFSEIDDQTLRKKLEAVVAQHESGVSDEIPPEVDAYPRFAFSRATHDRHAGALVRIRCAVDDEFKGGIIVGPIGRAYRVEIDDCRVIIVHEADDAWTMD